MKSDTELLEFAIKQGLCPSREEIDKLVTEDYWKRVTEAAKMVMAWPAWKRGMK